jgi:hypothetical protein
VTVDFEVTIFPCNAATLTVPSNPPDLVIDRSAVTNNVVQYAISPTYSSKIVSSNALCPVKVFSLQDTSGVGLVSSQVYLIDDSIHGFLAVKNDLAFTLSFRITGRTTSKNAYMTLNVRVCGTEALSLVNAATKSYIYGIENGDKATMLDSTRYFSITQATFESYFTLSPGGDPCTVNSYAIYSSLSPLTKWPVADS